MDEEQWFQTALYCAVVIGPVTFRPATFDTGTVCVVNGVAGDPSSSVVDALASALSKTRGCEFLLSTRPKTAP